MPFYSFHQSRFAGYAKVSFNITPYESFIRKATITLEGSQFGAPGNRTYHQTKVGMELYFRPSIAMKPLIQRAFVNYFNASDLTQVLLSQEAELDNFVLLGFEWNKTTLVNP